MADTDRLPGSDDEPDLEGTRPGPWPWGLAFGIERLGLVPLAHPLAVGLIALALCVAGVFGIGRISVDDSLSQLFRSDTPEFRQYEALTTRFPSSEFDVLVVVESPTLLARDNVARLRTFVTDLQLIDGTRGVISLFSARQPPQAGRPPGPVFPDKLPDGAAYDELVRSVQANEIIRGKLLSEDGQLALVLLALEPDVAQSSGLAAVVKEIRDTAATDLGGSDLTARLSGVPVMQLDIRNAVERDRLLYNAVGFIAGCLIAVLFFRRLSYMAVAAAPPLVAIVVALGALGWLGFRLNMFLNVMTPLIMVISFSDSMQLTFAARDRLLRGETKREAFGNAVRVVGPACVLTHATAGLSFVALQFSRSDLIRTFGEAGLIATVLALIAVLTLVPLLGMLLVRAEPAGARQMDIDAERDGEPAAGRSGTPTGEPPPGRTAGRFGAKRPDTAVEALRSFCGFIARRMVRRPGLYSLLGLLVVASLGVVYFGLEPRYRLADQVPDTEQAVAASQQLDAKLTGANPIDVLVEFPAGQDIYAPASLDTLAAVHTILETQAGVGNVWSLETLRRWLAEKAGVSDVETLKRYVEMLPEHLTRRFIAPDAQAEVVTGRIPDVDVSQLLPVVDRLEEALAPVRAAHPGTAISVTGLSAIAARNSADMIGKLNRGLTVEILFVAAFIGLAFRSWIVMLASILPAIFPVVLSGALLWLLGEGLQFSSVVALTVSFGLGLSATIHFLNRLRLEERPGRSVAVVVEQATVLVGPALILTSLVLACGLAVTVFSQLPSLRLFGWLSAFAMLAALVADLLILRPVVMVLRRTFPRSA